ncbi:hypothetical protein [Agriterribacter sp.]|uniref:hypothetical protein n=1 Tax=Agriterribacter sp. TaxID=2821509 RepID=UPI002C46EC9F|nr:hypothetical protein [Agriterribacter sp.]HRP57516.1 hypothetical protein [Agriterribacter sp.]
MDNTKIQFSADELRLAADEQFILTKNRIIEKVSVFFGALQSGYRTVSAGAFSSLDIVQHPKISRGENYNGLPYVILDYPRHFTKEDIFAIRTMFLWGNDFSITLHLKGRYKTLFEEPLIKNLPLLKHRGWHLQISGNEWQHHYTADTHLPVKDRAVRDMLPAIAGGYFIKIAFYFPLHQWDQAGQLFFNCFTTVMQMLDIRD